MTAMSDIARWCYKNPGIWSLRQISEATGIPRRTVSNAMMMLAEVETKLCQRVQSGVYLIRPPELAPEEEPERQEVFAAFDAAEREGRLGITAPPPPPEPEPAFSRDFVEILPDDDEIYPPFKVRIYDHFRGKRGEQWFRTKDEMGKRGIFRWIDDE